eukprot:9483954-Pyramimonas_sp.AAC.1
MRCHQAVPLALNLQQQRLRPDTSSQVVPKSRSRAGLPGNVYRNRALAWDFFAMYSDAALSALRNHALAVDSLASYL